MTLENIICGIIVIVLVLGFIVVAVCGCAMLITEAISFIKSERKEWKK